MKIIVEIEYPQDMSYLRDEAARLISKVLIKKLEPNEIKQLIEILEDDTKNITW